ncbi:MAG: hypothetical protein IKQ00_07935 [Butyrivibrio sp.]|nr:hypothetical protein [Butyrivibrio sp.]
MKNNDYYLKTFNCQLWKDNLFFISSDMNLIFGYSLKNDEIFFLPAHKENLLKRGLYGSIEVFDSEIYLIPLCASRMWKFNKKNEWEIVNLFQHSNVIKSISTIKYNDYLYIFGYEKAEIYKYEFTSGKIYRLNFELYDVIDERLGFFGMDYEIYNERIIVPVMCSNKLVIIDCKSDNIEIVDVQSKSKGFAGIVRDENGFWLAPRKGNYFVYYSDDGEIKDYKLPSQYTENGCWFGGAYLEGENILFTSFCYGNYIFDRQNPEDGEILFPSIYYFRKFADGTRIVSEQKGDTYYIDNNHKKKKLKLLITQEEKIRYITENRRGNELFIEGDNLKLGDYLKMICE